MMDGKPVVIVTGSSGLIGKAVIESLIGDYQVIGLDFTGNPRSRQEVENISVDLKDEQSVRAALRRVRHAYGPDIASVVHLAAYYDFSGEPSPLYEQVTVRGTQRLLRGLQEFQVGQFIFSSTMLVHGPTEPGRPINEDAPLEAKWDYPQSKIDAENIIRQDHGSIPFVLMRIAGVYTDRCDSIPIAQQIQRIYEERLTGRVYPADPSRGQSFIHRDDLVEAIRRGIDRRASLPVELAMLIGEPETFSYQQLQEKIGWLLHGEHWATRQIPAAVAKAGAWVQDKTPGVPEPFIKPWMIDLAEDHYEVDITRARQMLQWEPRHRLIDVLPKMIESLKRDPGTWYKRHELGEPPAATT
jgi:UDP-glucose 4-epimerase